MTSGSFTIRADTMRPIASADDAFVAAELLGQAASDDPDKFFALVPPDATANPVELAEDESVAVFEVYAIDRWKPGDGGVPIRRIVVRR